jgi:hypothetical protein
MNYQKNWDALNNLEMTTSKICSAREILDCAIEKLAEGDKTKAENLMYAADEFLQLYLKDFDEKFKSVWNEVIVKQKDDIDYLANDFLTKDRTSNFPNENKTKTWVLPVEADPSGEYFVTFPDDLLEAASLEEGDEIEWFDNEDGSYTLKKATTSETGTTTTPKSPIIS